MYNRTDGSPQDIFKKFGDAATSYVQTIDQETERLSNLSEKLPSDSFSNIDGLSMQSIRKLCSRNVFSKGKIFENRKSEIISTQVFRNKNTILGCYRAVKVYRQEIIWGNGTDVSASFLLDTVQFFCGSKYHQKTVKCFKHVIGQLGRVMYNTN